jgi:hypothetical protein
LIICLKSSFSYTNKILSNNQNADNALLTSFIESNSHFSGVKNNCGVELVLEFLAVPKVLKKKILKPRWPKPTSLNKKKPVEPIPIQCDAKDGIAIMHELRKLFPAPKRHHHKKLHKNPLGKIKKSIFFKSKKVTASNAANPVKLGSDPQKVLDLAKIFAKKMDDEAAANLAKFKAMGKPKIPKVAVVVKGKGVVKPKPKKRVRLTKEAKMKLRNAKTKAAQMSKARKECLFKIKQYLDPRFKMKYKGKQCISIGRLLKRCVNLP